MAHRASGIGGTGNGFPVAAGPVLAYQKLAVFPFYQQKRLPALRAFLSRLIFMTENAASRLDLVCQHRRVSADFLHKCLPAALSLRDLCQLHFPIGRKLRLF